MKKELDKSKASFKLDLIETANADPMLSPADFKLLSAYVAVMAWPSCRTWLAAPLAMAKTGLSHGQFWKSRARLLGENAEKRAYLIAVRSGGKVATYKLINPWRDEAIEHVEAMTKYHREAERQKKAGKRATSSLQNMEVFGILETAVHMLVDQMKVSGKTSFATDQALHMVCKVIWIAVIAAGWT